MKFIDLQSEYQYFKKDIDKLLLEVAQSGQYLFGPQLQQLEENFPKFIGKKYGIGVKNCTDAISMVLRRVYKEGMTIILPNFGAYPTAVASKLITDNLYYVDVNDSFTIDTNKLPQDIKNGIIIVVHLFGNNVNMSKIINYAQANNHIIIEDAAQSTGSGSGSDGSYSVFSFYPTKNLSSMGDGGMILTDNKDDMEYFKKLRFYGQNNSNEIELPGGINSRMDEFQCSIINSKLNKFQKLNDVRITIAERYKKIVKGIKINKYSINFLKNPRCVYHQFPLLFNEREKIIEELNKREIPYMIHYPYHVSDFDVMKGIYNDVGYRINDKIISLPVHPFIKEIEIQQIEEFLNDFKSYEC